MTDPLNPDWDGVMKARAKEPKSPATSFQAQYESPGPPPEDSIARALEYAKQVIQNYEAAVKASAWTGVNLEAVGFCQDTNYRDALATIDRLARGELVV